VAPLSASYLKLDRPAAFVALSVLKGMITGEAPKVGEVGKLDRRELASGKGAARS
jgi:hypothetical protein